MIRQFSDLKSTAHKKYKIHQKPKIQHEYISLKCEKQQDV